MIAQIVCDQLQIEFLTLIKAKSIREFDDHYAKKLITHAIYLNLTVQDHTIDTASMLITWLNQHQMILEKTWMNKIDLVIDMRIDFLWFSNFNPTSQKSIALSSSRQFNEKSVKLIEQSKSRDAVSFSVNSKSTSDSMNIAMIETATYKMLVKWSDVKIFAVIILKIDRLITTAENKLEEVNLHELSHVETLKSRSSFSLNITTI